MRSLALRPLCALVALSALSACSSPGQQRGGPLRPSAPRAAVVVDWPQTAITSLGADRQLVQLVATRHFGYTALRDEDRARLAADLRRSGVPASLDQAVCVRNLLYKLQLDTQRASLSPAAIARYYATATASDLAACASHFETPPLEVVRALVRHAYGLSEFLTRKVVEATVSFIGEGLDADADPAQLAAFRLHLARLADERRLGAHAKRELARFSRGLRAHDWAQFVWACRHDMQGRPKQITMDDAEAGERLLEAHLLSCGAAFRTERDLRLEQQAQQALGEGGCAAAAGEAGRRSTPDILFEPHSRVRLGGADDVRWIDMKNMCARAREREAESEGRARERESKKGRRWARVGACVCVAACACGRMDGPRI
jgi:hypothetical protein